MSRTSRPQAAAPSLFPPAVSWGLVFLLLAAAACPAAAAPARPEPLPLGHRWPLEPAPREQIETVLQSPHRYEISLGGTLDGECTRSHQDYSLPWRVAFEPNRYVVIANQGREDVVNPRLVVEGRGSWQSRREIVESVVAPGMAAEETARALWLFLAENTYRVNQSWGIQYLDPVVGLNTYGFGECIGRATVLAHLAREAGLEAILSGPDHWVARLSGDGASRLLDPDYATAFVPLDGTGLASEEELIRDHHLGRLTHTGGIGAPDHPQDDSTYTEIFDADRFVQEPFAPTPRDLSFRLRPGEAVYRSWQNWGKYSSSSFGPTTRHTPPPYFGNGRTSYAPDLADTLFLAGADSVAGVACVAQDGLEPNLHSSHVGQTGSLVYRTACPYVIVGGAVRGAGRRGDASDLLRVRVSRDGASWVQVWAASETGPLDFEVSLDDWVDPHDLPCLFELWIRVDIRAAHQLTSVGLDSLTLETDFHLAPRFLPALRLGPNPFLYQDDTPGEHQVVVAHGWEESSASRPPAAPRLRSPAPGSPNVSLRPLFDWDPAPDPDGDPVREYRIQVSERSDFRWPVSPDFDRYLSQTRFAGLTHWIPPYDGLLVPGATYYWRVAARDSGGAWSAWSAPLSFVPSGPGRPGAMTATPRGKRITLTWSPASSGRPPARYRIYASDEQGFSPGAETFVSETLDASFEAVTPFPRYPGQNRAFYRVVAVDSAGVASAASDCLELPHPFIFTEPPTLAFPGSAYTYRPGVLSALKHDRTPEEDRLTLTALTLPPWLAVRGDSLYGSPQPGREGLWPVALRVSDGHGGETEQRYLILVERGPEASCRFVLAPGCDLVPRNLQSPEEDPAAAFADIADHLAYAMDFDGEPRFYFPAHPESSSLTAVRPGRSYWLRMEQPDTLVWRGAVREPYDTALPLQAGWNLVPFLPHGADSVAHALGAVMDHVEAVLGLPGSGAVYDPDLPELSTLHLLEPGNGYWLETSAADTLIYPGDTAAPLPPPPNPGAPPMASGPRESVPSPYWGALYGDRLLRGDFPVPAETPIEVLDTQGLVCGKGAFSEPGHFGFLTVWEDDPVSSTDEGTLAGEALRFCAGSYEAVPSPIYAGWGTRVPLNGTFLPMTPVPWEASRPAFGFDLECAAGSPAPGAFRFRLSLPSNDPAALEIYSVAGRRVATPAGGRLGVGVHDVLWDGREAGGREAASGVYLVRLTQGTTAVTRKIVLAR